MELEQIEFEDSRPTTPYIVESTRKRGKKDKKKESLWDKMFRKNKLKKPNMVAVLFLRNNGVAEPLEVQSKKGFLNIYGRTYHEDRDCIYTIKKGRTPLAIIPEWSLVPYGTQKWHEKPMLEKFAELQDHALRGIRHAELVRSGDRDGKKINPKVAVGLLILGIIAFAIIRTYL